MYEIKLKEVPNMLAITLRGFSNMQNISEDMGKFYHELWDYWVKNGLEHDGGTQCFALYHGEFNPQKIDIECGFSVKKQMPAEGRVKCREVEGQLMASTVHTGSYQTLENAYNAIFAWMNENGYEISEGPMRDVYFNDPAVTPENELKTESLFPVRKKQQ